jgi:hypothetical protein
LPAAPPTESSASTSGTPAADIVERVRNHRAMVALRMTGPNSGIFNKMRSITTCIAGERRQACMKE